MRCVVSLEDDPMKLQERMTAVKLQAEHLMACIIPPVSKEEKVAERPHLLTAAVPEVFAEAPSDLQWVACPNLTGCWIAEVPTSDNKAHQNHSEA